MLVFTKVTPVGKSLAKTRVMLFKVACELNLPVLGPGISLFRGHGHSRFAKVTPLEKLLKQFGKLFKGHQGEDLGGRDSAFVVPCYSRLDWVDFTKSKSSLISSY